MHIEKAYKILESNHNRIVNYNYLDKKTAIWNKKVKGKKDKG
jgi:hypothetical protein